MLASTPCRPHPSLPLFTSLSTIFLFVSLPFLYISLISFKDLYPNYFIILGHRFCVIFFFAGRFCIEFKSTTFAAIKRKRKAFYLVFIALYTGYGLAACVGSLVLFIMFLVRILFAIRPRETNNTDMTML